MSDYSINPDGLNGQRWMAAERELFKANTTIEFLTAENEAQRATIERQRRTLLAAKMSLDNCDPDRALATIIGDSLGAEGT